MHPVHHGCDSDGLPKRPAPSSPQCKKVPVSAATAPFSPGAAATPQTTHSFKEYIRTPYLPYNYTFLLNGSTNVLPNNTPIIRPGDMRPCRILRPPDHGGRHEKRPRSPRGVLFSSFRVGRRSRRNTFKRSRSRANSPVLAVERIRQPALSRPSLFLLTQSWI